MAQKIPIYIPTYISADNYAPARVQPRVLYSNGMLECETFYIQGFSTPSTASVNVYAQTSFPYFDNYNVVTGSFPTTESNSLLFYNEESVYGTKPVNSLYSIYWSDYVNLLYSPRTRLLNMAAIIPLADYIEMELNDIVNFRGNDYHLRALNDYNLSTGEVSIQLLGPILEGSLDGFTPNVFEVTNNGSGNYVINGQSNPTLTVSKGKTYVFNLNIVGSHPFWIKTNISTGTGNAYNTGVTNNGANSGTITFDVPYNAPSTLYYNCQYHSSMAGTINVVN